MSKTVATIVLFKDTKNWSTGKNLQVALVRKNNRIIDLLYKYLKLLIFRKFGLIEDTSLRISIWSQLKNAN
jgi:hypothetical protein